MKKLREAKFTRYSVFVLITIFIFAAIITKLSILQVFNSETYKEKANNSSIREIPDAAPRGEILDKNGKKFAANTQSYILVYNPTTESDKVFFSTMETVFKILDENGESQSDDFELKINPFQFQFKTDDANTKRSLEIKFKRDRGLNEEIEKKLYPKKKDKLTDAEKSKVDEELLKISPEDTYKKLVKQYGISSKYSLEEQRRFMIVKDTNKMQSFSGYKPVTIASNMKQQTAFIFLQKLNELPGIDVMTQPIRTYPNGEIGSAFLGYISKITSNDETYQEKGYDTSTDYVGASGLEAVFEDRLKGSKGGRIVKLNKQGRITEELGSREPYPGQNIKLTIDGNVQIAAEKALDATMAGLRANPNQSSDTNSVNATRGAAVAIDVNTGGIIALASRPGYDPNLFASPGRLNTDMHTKLFGPDLEKFGRNYIEQRGLMQYYPGKTEDEVLNILFPIDTSIKNNKTIRKDMYDLYPKPMYDYATSALLPPGSTFKPMTAVAGLESGAIDPYTTIHDNLVYTKNNFNGGELNTWSYGDVNVVKAIEVSNNYFFYEVGDRLLTKGFDTLAKYAWKFGLGVDPKGKENPTTGIEIPEAYGQVANLESIRNLYSTMDLINLVNKINQDYGIDLRTSSSDSKEIKSIKDDIKNNIKTQMRYKNVNNFSADLKDKLKQFISLVPALSSKNFSDKYLKNVIQQINITVNISYSQATMPGNMYNAAIGQGVNNFTPLQLANYIATIVNGGNRNKLHLVDQYLDANNKVIEKVKPEVIEKVNLKQSTIDAVKQGMQKVTSAEDGTASYYFTGFPIATGGKTGSATLSDKQAAMGRTSYAVYVGFAPYDNPQIAICVVIFDGGHGGFVAPVARAMYEAYFKDELAKMNYTPTYNYGTMK